MEDRKIPDSAEVRGRGRPRDAAKEDAIISAAQCLFMERGFSGVSMDAIAEAAGVAKATLYARFGDKDGLLRAAISAKCHSFLDEETLDPPAGRSVRECLTHLARRFVALVTSPASVSMHRLFLSEHDRAPHLPQLFYETAILPTKARVVAYLEREVARGRLNLPDPEGGAWRFLGMVKGQADLRAMLNLPPLPEEIMEGHIAASVDMFLRAYGMEGVSSANGAPPAPAG